ncbi:hypothetical protein [Dickeya oryzae]|uniref:hypothetical protein n=1 Tax=Dickeya oryzae TaxID=1240404 RepID=UPI001AEC8BC8|nr:hypothetical protein [Dickeya oryzae]MBP2850472.1 hypothetical protein [Dickeya oryzae]
MEILNPVHDYFQNTVKPTIAEFLQDRTDLRKARIAAIVLFHMRDYAMECGMGTPCDSLTDRRKLMHDVVRAAANASKHYRLRRHRNQPEKDHIASCADQMQVEESAGLFNNVPFGDGVFAEANEVFLILDDNKQSEWDGVRCVNLSDAILTIQNFWDEFLNNSN